MRGHSKTTQIAFWVAASMVTLFPIYWMFVVSAKSRVELFGKPNFIIKSAESFSRGASLQAGRSSFNHSS